MLDHIMEYAAYIAVIAYSISGAIIGIEKKFDILGIFLITIINTISGGILRDLLADQIPTLLSNPIYMYLIIASVTLTLILKLYKVHLPIDGKIYVICDAIGLSSFSIIGGLVAIEKNLNLISILIFSVVTAIGGSVARDIVLNKVPAVFKTDFYTAIALIIGFILFILQYFLLLDSLSIFLLFCSGIILRIIAYWKEWKLPIINT
jgi:uncharacterized membrane protein YeiH